MNIHAGSADLAKTQIIIVYKCFAMVPFLDQLSQGCLFHAGHIFKVESMECFKLGKTKYLAVCNLNVVPVISAHENQL